MARLIKKYKNRRLYDTETSQYITLENLQRYVLEDIPFVVEDSSSSKDLTNEILLQILVEMQSHATSVFSTDMLRQIIILANHPMNEIFKKYLGEMIHAIERQTHTTQVLEEYQKASKQWNEQLKQVLQHWQDFFKT